MDDSALPRWRLLWPGLQTLTLVIDRLCGIVDALQVREREHGMQRRLTEPLHLDKKLSSVPGQIDELARHLEALVARRRSARHRNRPPAHQSPQRPMPFGMSEPALGI